MKVKITLEFDDTPLKDTTPADPDTKKAIREAVHDYLCELMDDNSLEYEVEYEVES